MIEKPKVSGSTIAYQLRHRKAIERNLFVNILQKLDRFLAIDIKDYRYVGFGAASLEDFKALHSEFRIDKMDCIEMNHFAYTRQEFNNPYNFIKLYRNTSTEYITGIDFKQDLNQIIWWDFAEPSSIRQQLQDIELTAGKISEYDVFKITLNAEINSFLKSHQRDYKQGSFFRKDNRTYNRTYNLPDYNVVLAFLKSDPTYKLYLPDRINARELMNDFPGVVRSMAVRAISRGLSRASSTFSFNHIASFTYADGQLMTTITGVMSSVATFENIVDESSLGSWEFYNPSPKADVFPAIHIEVPVMTIAERAEIDKMIHRASPDTLAKGLKFFYGTTLEEHLAFIKGYCKFYRYLPYYSKVIY